MACNHTLDRGRLVFPMEGVDQVAPPPRWARLTGWPGAMVAGWPAKLVGLPPYDTAKEACVMDGGTGCQTHVGLAC